MSWRWAAGAAREGIVTYTKLDVSQEPWSLRASLQSIPDSSISESQPGRQAPEQAPGADAQPPDQAPPAAAMSPHSTGLQPSQANGASDRAQEGAERGSEEAGSQVLQHLEARSPNAAAQKNAERMELPEPSPWRVRRRKENSAPASAAKRAKQAEHSSPNASTRLSCSPGRRAAGQPSSPPPHAYHAFSQEAAAAKAGLQAALRAAGVSLQPSASILPPKDSPSIAADHDRTRAGLKTSSCASPSPAKDKTILCAAASWEHAPGVPKQRPGQQPAPDLAAQTSGALRQQASQGEAREQGRLCGDIVPAEQAEPQPPQPLPAAGQGETEVLLAAVDTAPGQHGQPGSAAAAGCESVAPPAPVPDLKRGTLSSDAHNAAHNAALGQCEGRPASLGPVLGTVMCTEVEVLPSTLVEAARPSQRRATPGTAAVHAVPASQACPPIARPGALQAVPGVARAAVAGLEALTAAARPCSGPQQAGLPAQPTELEVQVSSRADQLRSCHYSEGLQLSREVCCTTWRTAHACHCESIACIQAEGCIP